MEPVPIPRDDMIGTMKFVSTLLNEKSERSFAIVASARIESLLTEIVTSASGSYPGYSKGVHTLRTIGLIDEDTAKCLKLLWDIRCKFAHDPDNCSFDETRLKKLLSELRTLVDPHMAAGIAGLETKMRSDLKKQLGWEPSDDWLPGTGPQRYLALTTMLLMLHLLAARSLIPAPITPPSFGVFQFKSV